MTKHFPASPETPGQHWQSRRSLLQGAAVAGLSAIAGAGLAAQPRQRPSAAAPAGTADALAALTASSGHMVLDYQPSQPTGWPAQFGQPVGATVGGHVPSADFTYAGTAYTVSLVPFGQAGDSPDPVYEAVPADPDIKFQQTLDSAFSDYYAFRYEGDSPDWGQLAVQSYSTFAAEPTQSSPLLRVGADLYVVHLPGGRWPDPALRGNLRWIQVVNNGQPLFVDCSRRANPFFEAAGLTSVYGRQAVSFADTPQVGANPGTTQTLPSLWTAETFLAEDTGKKDRSGKGIIDIFGGLKYGWQIRKQ